MIHYLKGFKRKKWLLWILTIFVFTSCLALLTYAVKNGGVSHDGSHYLRVAKSFLNGDGFSTLAFQGIEQPPSERFPVIRPVGYPVVIALVAGLFQIPVLFGAKAASILCAIGLAVLFHRLYGFQGLTITVILLTSLFLELYFSVLSGGVFTFLLVFWVWLMSDGFNKGFTWFRIVIIAFVGAILFTTRYVGIVVLPVLGILTFYNPTKLKLEFNQKGFITLVSTALLIASYLAVNYEKSGLFFPPHVTQHPFQQASILWLIGDYMWEVFNSLNMLFSILYRGESWRIISTIAALFLQIGIVVFWFRKLRPSIQRYLPLKPLTKITWITAIVYLAMLLGIYLVKFYTFSYRFIVPALMLLAWGGFHQVYHTQSKSFLKALRYCMFSIAIVSVGFNGLFRAGYHLFWKPTPTFSTHLSTVKSKYKRVPKNAFVIFPAKDLNYLRTDVIAVYGALTSSPGKYLESVKAQDKNQFYLNTCNPEFSAFMHRTYPKKREKWRAVADTAQPCLLKIP